MGWFTDFLKKEIAWERCLIWYLHDYFETAVFKKALRLFYDTMSAEFFFFFFWKNVSAFSWLFGDSHTKKNIFLALHYLNFKSFDSNIFHNLLNVRKLSLDSLLIPITQKKKEQISAWWKQGKWKFLLYEFL